MKFTLLSTAFSEGKTIPMQYTCDSKGISPALQWNNIPANTKSLVLIMDDPDAPMGTWDHWILFNIPASTTMLEENTQQLPPGTLVGQNSWKRNAYGGPCPPDREHRYFFKLYALDNLLDLPTGATKTQVEKAMQGHVLGEAQLMGRYNRVKK